MIKKDNIPFGIFIGLVLPVALYGLLYLVSMGIETGTAWTRPFGQDRLMLASIFINLLPIRVYFVNWKLDKTGRGVLLATFFLTVVYFVSIRYF